MEERKKSELAIGDVGQGYNWPKPGDQDQEIKPQTHNKIVL